MFSDKIPPGTGMLPAVNSEEAVAVIAAELTIIEKVPATVEATQATLISSRLMARIIAVNVRAGDNVARGDLVLELENSDVQAKVQQAEANVNATSARLREAKQNLERVQELRDSGVMSAADLDRAIANHEALLEDMTGENQALEEVRTALTYTGIVAPFDGRIVDRFAEPGDTAMPGRKLLALYNPLNLRVEAQVRETLALDLQVGQQLQVEIPSMGKIVDAVIEERVPAADPGSRSFLVKAGMAFDSDMLPGMYARLLVPAGMEKQLLIPSNRVAHIGQLDLVWMIQGGLSNRRFIRTGKIVGHGQIEVLSGLAEGDMILPVP